MRDKDSVIGKKLEELMRAMGLSQTEMASRLGIRQPTLSAYVNGSAKPSLDMIYRIAEVANCTFNQLLGDEDIRPIDGAHADLRPSAGRVEMIPYVSINAQGAFIDNYEDLEAIPLQRVMMPNGMHAGDIAFQVDGSAMEDRLQNRSVVFCKEVRNWTYLPSNLSDMYMVLYGSILVVKYIINRTRVDGVFELHSHNKELFPPETIEIDAVKKIWKVLTAVQPM